MVARAENWRWSSLACGLAGGEVAQRQLHCGLGEQAAAGRICPRETDSPKKGVKQVKHHLPQRPGGCFAQMVPDLPDPFFLGTCELAKTSELATSKTMLPTRSLNINLG
jgi:hypothetical protein